MLPDSADNTLGYIYAPGTSVLTFLNNAAGFVVLDSVPAGTVSAVSYSSTNSTVSSIIRHEVPVAPGDTTVVWNPSWKYARRIFLNTTAGGAAVAGDVVNFPVLVRLTAGNFTFSQAQADGADIRFTKPGNTFLPYEIKRWDPAAGLAEVWVTVDTVFGNDRAQFIAMYWGNTDAADSSNGGAVFDTAGGFEGVWHLNETSGTSARDASHNGFSGTYRGGLPKGEPGPLGICQNIVRPDSDYVDMGNVLNPGMKNISVGVWIKRGSFVTPQGLIAKTNGDLPSTAYGYLLSIDPADAPHFNMASGGAQWGDDGTFEVASNLAVTDTTTWHYVFVVIDRSDNARCKMYLDGIDRTGVRGGNIARISSVANALNVHIGTESDRNCSFKGAIGEATIAFTARSADWVKLSYMNQKEKDALVTW
jgi:biopolymer transport protein ExbB